MGSKVLKDRQKILVIDDSQTVRMYLKKILDEAGYMPVIAPEVKRVFKFIKKENPDLILLDILRDDLSGYEICKKNQGNGKDQKYSGDFSYIEIR